MTDGANGARGEALKDGVTAACFPACTALAACWDGTMAFQMGEALGQETKTKGAHVLYGLTSDACSKLERHC
jgi:beta-glucosidase